MNEYMNNAMEIITEWNDMTPEQQLKFCQVCVCKAIKRGRTLRPLYDLEDATQETYCKMLQRLADADKLARNIEQRASKGFSDSLATIVSRAANATMEGIAYHSNKDSRAISQTITSENGEELDMLDIIAAKSSTEESAIFRATIKQFLKGLDKKDQKILAGRIQGKTEREIAPAVGITAPAAHKRIVKIRAELAELL